MKKLYDFYLKHVKHTKYVELTFEEFGDMITKLDYIVEKDNNHIRGLLLYGVDEFVDINMVIGEVSSYKPMVERLIARTTKDIRIHYRKSFNLAWYAHHHMIHLNEQGVIYNSSLHKVYLELGFIETSIQDTYYLDLNNYDMNHVTIKQLEELNSKAYDVTLYNPLKHTHMDDFLDNLHSQSFKEAIKRNHNKQHPDPLLIVTKDNKVKGFTGPLRISPDFRGVFSGIEILEDIRGLGLGKILFQRLCYTLKQMGAQYMTLFTGRDNAAKYIYMSSGFKLCESFSLMIYKR